eukprot:259118_1
MVRQKSRWLLVKIDLEESVKNLPSSDKLPPKIEKKNLYHALCAVIQDAFGIYGAGLSEEIHVRLYNQETRVAILRVPRHHAPVVQAALTMLTSVNDIPLAATVLSNNGSARTCKISALTQLKRDFFVTMRMKDDGIGKNEEKALKEKLQLKLLRKLDVQMAEIRSID